MSLLNRSTGAWSLQRFVGGTCIIAAVLALPVGASASGGEDGVRLSEGVGTVFLTAAGGVSLAYWGLSAVGDLGLLLAGGGVEGAVGLYVAPSVAVSIGGQWRASTFGIEYAEASYKGCTVGASFDLGQGWLLHGLLGAGVTERRRSEGDSSTCSLKATVLPMVASGLDKLWSAGDGLWLGFGASLSYSQWGEYYSGSSCLQGHEPGGIHSQVEVIVYFRGLYEFLLW